MNATRMLLAIVLAVATGRSLLALPYTVLHTFSGPDGSRPEGIVLVGSRLYGSTDFEGANGHGTIFALDVDGTGFEVLRHPVPLETGSGAPIAVGGATIYGTSVANAGAVFQMDTDGTNYQTVFPFTTLANHLWRPRGFALSGSTLYGTTQEGGLGTGGVYRVNTDGTGYQQLHAFTAAEGTALYAPTVSGSTIYAINVNGGVHASGMIYRIETDGSGFDVLHDFLPNDGSPAGSLLEHEGVLYGGMDDFIFRINIDGTGFEVLHTFNFTNGFGASTSLVYSGGSLYGGTLSTVFRIDADGSDFRTLHTFNPNTDGRPFGPLVMSGKTLFGTNLFNSATGNDGRIYSLVVPEPQTWLLIALGWPALACRGGLWRRAARRGE
jgi:uncharacterized repeat protein (TIGR03803 family)